MAKENGAAGKGVGSGSSPASSKASFKAARDGKASEPVREKPPTKQQERAAGKVVKLQKQNANKIEQTSAKAALKFNVRAEGLPQSKSTAHVKQKQAYKAKDGQTYTSLEAIKAAKNLEQAKQVQAAKAQVKKHHAPAPKPRGVAQNANRGRSTVQTKTHEQPKKARNDYSKLNAMEQRILAHSLQNANQNSKQVQQSKELGR